MARPGRSFCISKNRSNGASQQEVFSDAISLQSSFISKSASFKKNSESSLKSGVYSENCEENFTLSGSDPPKTVGPLSKSFHVFVKHSPEGPWTVCEKKKRKSEKNFEACETCPRRAPYGPYGPWSKKGPATFISPKIDFLMKVYPSTTKRQRNGFKDCTTQPMGKMGPWPLSGSCRYAGRPYGPCRPFGAFKSRGPFGFWNFSVPQCVRPPTPIQPCWRPRSRGRRPCTPCYRPLYRPCKPCKG